MTETVREIQKGAWQSPLKVPYSEGYAPNEADCFYAADCNFRRWLRANVNHLMTGWDEGLHDKPGFLKFCMWAQLQFLDHMEGMALTVASNGFAKLMKEFHEGDRDVQEYEDTNNSSIEWGDERGKTEGCPHLMFYMHSEFRKPDWPEQWFMLMFTNREQSSDDTCSWFAPERPRDAYGRTSFRDMRALGRHMLKEVKAAEQELKSFWAEYEKLYPLSDEPEEWRG
jgi:hypothetical protein